MTYGDTSGSVGARDASVTGMHGPSRVWVRVGNQVLYSPFQYRKRNQQPSASSSSTTSIDDHEVEEDEEQFYTPDQGNSPDMDMYSSDVGRHSGDSNMSSEVDDDMDFYAVESSQPPVTADQPQTPAPTTMGNTMRTTQRPDGPNTPVNATVRLNTAKLHELRAKLLANRQATPVKDASNSINNTNAVSVKTESQSRPQSPAVAPNAALLMTKPLIQPAQSKNNRPTAASMLNQSNSVDALLAEGHATAMISQSETKTQQKTAPMDQLNTTDPTTKPAAGTKLDAAKQTKSPAVSHNQFNTAEQTIANSDKSSSTAKSPNTPNQQKHKSNSLTSQKTNLAFSVPEQKHPNDKIANMNANQDANATKPVGYLSNGLMHKQNPDLMAGPRKDSEDEYFKDVDLWLQITGFHDTSFREQKLKTYKMRAVLEEKKRALEREFAELERQEAAAANDPSTKDYSRAVSAVYMPPPRLPAMTSTDEQSAPVRKASPTPSQPASAGAKRPRSPSVAVNNDREKLSRLNTSDRAVRRDDLFDRPLSASASRRGSDQRSHWTTDRPDYRQRSAFDASPPHQSISVRGQAFRPNDNGVNRRESWTPRSPEQWSARSHGWNTSFSDVNEQPIGQSNKCGYKPCNPRNRYNR